MNLEARLIRVLANPDCDVEALSKQIYQTGDQDDIIEAKSKVNDFHDDIAQQMKKNVYKNNSIFIDTARDISYLESEMFILNQKINEQKTLINMLQSLVLAGNKNLANENNEDANKSSIFFSDISHEIENDGILNQYCEEMIVHQGHLYQMDENDLGIFNVVRKCHCFLLESTFLICSIKEDVDDTFKSNDIYRQRRLEPKLKIKSYKYRLLFNLLLQSLAVINVKEPKHSLSSPKYLIKLLVFPENIILKCNSEENKNIWLTAIDETKRGVRKPLAPQSTVKKQLTNEKLLDKNLSNKVETKNEPFILPDWINDFTDEIDLLVAQKQYDRAVIHLDEVKGWIKDFRSSQSFNNSVKNDSDNSKMLDELIVRCNDTHRMLVQSICDEIMSFEGSAEFEQVYMAVPQSLSTTTTDPWKSIGKSNDTITNLSDSSDEGKKSTTHHATYHVNFSYETILYQNMRPINITLLRALASLGQPDLALNLYLNYHVSAYLIGKQIASLTYGKSGEGDTLAYVRRCGTIFWGCIAQTAWFLRYGTHEKTGFLQGIPDVNQMENEGENMLALTFDQTKKEALAFFLIWLIKYEIKRFTGHIVKLIKCVLHKFIEFSQHMAILRDQCRMLSKPQYKLDIDVLYALDMCFNPWIKKSLDEHVEIICEQSREKVYEDRFDMPFSQLSDKNAVQQYISNVQNMLSKSTLANNTFDWNLNSLIVAEEKAKLDTETACNFLVYIAPSTLSFAQHFIELVISMGLIYTNDRYKLFKDAIIHTFLNHIQYLTTIPRATRYKNSPTAMLSIKMNIQYLLNYLVKWLNLYWSTHISSQANDDFKTLSNITLDDILQINQSDIKNEKTNVGLTNKPKQDEDVQAAKSNINFI